MFITKVASSGPESSLTFLTFILKKLKIIPYCSYVPQSQDFLLHMPVGNGSLGQEAASGDRLTTAAPTQPMLPAPDLTTPTSADPVCSCEACIERRWATATDGGPACACFKFCFLWTGALTCREISAESERESQQLQNHWSEVRYLVRCIYRQAGTPLAEDHDQPLERDKEGMKELVDR